MNIAEVIHHDSVSGRYQLFDRIHDPNDLSGWHPESRAIDSGVSAIPTQASDESDRIFGITNRVFGNYKSFHRAVERYRITDEDRFSAPCASYGHLFETGMAVRGVAVFERQPRLAGTAMSVYPVFQPGLMAAIGHDRIKFSGKERHVRVVLKVQEGWHLVWKH